MKQGSQLRLSQQLTMTPQLQQAIRLLQLSTVELQQEIQQALESNPLLEQIDNLDEISLQSSSPTEQQDTVQALEQTELPQGPPLDASWDELYSSSSSPEENTSEQNYQEQHYPEYSGTAYSGDDMPVYQGETIQTLRDHLQWQAEMAPFSDTQAAIAVAIIDAIDDTGYLTVPLTDIVDSMGDDQITQQEVEEVLKCIQRFDPIGVAARDLSECLRIQLSQLAENTPFLADAYLIVDNYLNLLGNHDFRNLIRSSKLREESLKGALQLIRTLEPRPGYSIDNGETEYVIPDVLLRKVSGHWIVELNPDSLPRLRVNSHYAALGGRGCNEQDSLFIRNNLQEAKWLIKSLESRNETLLKVARCIVEQQQLFFEYGEEHMKPMVLADIAQAVEMHESTISRVTTQKFLYSPRGTFELKYFFSSHVSQEDGGEASSTAIRALVKRLIAEENPVKPLSDSKLATMLAEQGIIVARRTVAKYRESLSIPPSNLRKQLV